ncbi:MULTISPECIES: hypothetical protein [unclassified Microcoleus]|uniref:hypothetical protein n=1 Tax=unclassified Microcoleus TaxID=2642155 RepID=UPI0025DD5812|nr:MULTISPECIES: hypothetical protein [unclassified Microcoleus]
MAQKYTLTFQNNSSNNWDFCCFQQDPDMNNPEVMSLAWFALPVAQTTSVSFTWEIDYQFVWSQAGTLSAGVIFSASQKWDADLTTSNNVNFTRRPNGAFTFQNQAAGGQVDTLYIHQDATIPANAAAVGINMGIVGSPPGTGTGTFVVPAQMNISATFTPHPEYWCTFGQYTPGQVLDIGEMTEKAQIIFPPNVYQMVATLTEENTWDVKSLQSVNAAFLAGDTRRAHALLGSSRTVQPNMNAKLSIGKYTAKCTGAGSYKFCSANTVNFNNQVTFEVIANDTIFSNKGATAITLTF